MALPSYYTPTKPYSPPRFAGEQVQRQLYAQLGENMANYPGMTPLQNMQTTESQGPASGSYPGMNPLQNMQTLEAQGPNRPTAPAAPAPGGGGGGGYGGGGGGGYSFEGDPILAQIRALNAKTVAQAQAAALAGRKQAQIGYGYDPNVKYEDEATAEAAKQNAFSTLAQLLYQHGERGYNLDENLNKGNLFYSGERARQIGREGRQYTLEQSTANQGFQQVINTIAQQLMQAELEAQQREIQAQSDAYNRALQFGLQYGGYGGGGGGGGGGDMSDFRRNAPASLDVESIYNAAQQYAPTYGGVQFVPGNIAQEGVAPPGYKWIKYVDPTGRQGGDTVLVPVG